MRQPRESIITGSPRKLLIHALHAMSHASEYVEAAAARAAPGPKRDRAAELWRDWHYQSRRRGAIGQLTARIERLLYGPMDGRID